MRTYQYNNLSIEQYSNRKKGQVLLFVLFFLIFVGIVAGGLVRMWESGVQITPFQEYASQAFYLAQAGIERGKIEILNDVNNINGVIDPSGNWPGPTINDWDAASLDIAGDNYTFQYNFSVDNFAGPQITITGRGEVLNVNNVVLGHREIAVTIDDIEDLFDNANPPNPPQDGIDDDNSGTVVSWSWHEI